MILLLLVGTAIGAKIGAKFGATADGMAADFTWKETITKELPAALKSVWEGLRRYWAFSANRIDCGMSLLFTVAFILKVSSVLKLSRDADVASVERDQVGCGGDQSPR